MGELSRCYDCGTEAPLFSTVATRVNDKGNRSTQSIALCRECFKKETGRYPD